MKVKAEDHETPDDLLTHARSIQICLAELLGIQFDADLQLTSQAREGLMLLVQLQKSLTFEAQLLLSYGEDSERTSEEIIKTHKEWMAAVKASREVAS